MEVIAHRGANKEALENSPTALALAAGLGIKRIELDVQRSADGVFVINHDDSLLHTTGHDIDIGSVNYSDIAAITLSNGEAVPRLDDVLRDILPRVELNIEVKFADTAAIKPLIDLVSQHDGSKVVFSSFHQPIMAKIGEFFGPWRLALLEEHDHQAEAAFRFCTDQRIAIIHPYYKMVTSEFMSKARALGLKVYPYTGMVDEDSDQRGIWHDLKELGIDGLCTNYPRELKQWLAQST